MEHILGTALCPCPMESSAGEKGTTSPSLVVAKCGWAWRTLWSQTETSAELSSAGFCRTVTCAISEGSTVSLMSTAPAARSATCFVMMVDRVAHRGLDPLHLYAAGDDSHPKHTVYTL